MYAMKHSASAPAFAKLLAAALLLASLGSCAGHGSLSQKTRWYKHHSGGKSVPCPCGH